MKITLLSALPHSQVDVENARHNPQKDYVHSILQGYTLSAAEIWSNIQHVLGAQAKYLFSVCERHGVSVVPRAGKAELANAALKSNVIILLAHWKGPEVAYLPPDLLQSIHNLVNPIKRCVERKILARELLSFNWDAVHERAARERIAKSLNETIDHWEKWLPFDDLGREAQALAISSAYGRNYARTIIDEIFGGANLLPGARLELADGLWRPAEIAEMFPDGWSGLCDFFCCTSDYLAEETKCQRPSANFRADSRYIRPGDAFAALSEMIPLIRHGTSVTEEFLSTYMEIAYSNDRGFGGA